MSELKKQTVSGVKWLVGSSFLQKAIQTGATIFLARILGPADFGLFALAFVAIDALGLFKSMGFDSALIQRKDDVEKAANTAFFVIPVLGTVLYLILFVSAPFIAQFMNNAQLTGIVRALGLIFVISCLGKVPAALLEKSMKFKQVSIIEVGTAVVYAVSAVSFALLKFGVWSLVYAYILKTLYQNILTFIYARWRPRLEFNKKIAKEMFHFGKFLFLGGVVWFLKMNLDNMLIGRFLGVAALGVYALAFNISHFVADYFSAKVQRVLFPAFSTIQHSQSKLKNALLKSTKVLSMISVPYCAILLLLGDYFIQVIYGYKWISAAPVLKVLAVAGLVNTLPSAIGILLNACGMSKINFFLVLFQVSIFFIFIIPAANYFGLIGVGFVVIFAQSITFFISLYYVLKLTATKITDYFNSLKVGLLLGVVIVLVNLLVKLLLINKLNIYFKYIYLDFLILIICSVFSCLLFLRFFDKNMFIEIKNYFIYNASRI